MTVPHATVAVVLAAGAGARFDGATHKLAATLSGRSVLHHVLEAVCRAGFVHVLVVTGAQRLADLDPDAPAAAIEVHHAGWARGQATSLQAGLTAAGGLGAAAVVVGLGDQPGVTTDAWRSVAAAVAPLAVATYGGRRGHPVRLAAAIWPLLPREGDAGARVLMRARPDLVAEVPCHGEPADVDTVEDLRRHATFDA
jgi:molybdenum cofactor cytidylyltransferase